MPMSKKRAKTVPRLAHAPAEGTKQPVADEHLIEDIGPLAWRFSGADKGGPFSWASLKDGYQKVVEHLHEFETKSWDEIKRAGCHPIEISRLEKGARDRLQAIKRDDLDALMSFRVGGAERVWAIQEPGCRNIMRVLWWDPAHSVYRTERDKGDRIKRKNRSK